MAEERSTSNGARGGPRVPALLVTTADWAWRLLIVGTLIYFLMKIVERVSVVAIPCALALLLTALLHPLVERLRRWGLPSLAATWIALLLAIGLLVGVGVIVGERANSEFPKLLTELDHTSKQVQNWLTTGPLHIKKTDLTKEVNKGLTYLKDRQSELVNTALSATLQVVEFIAGFILMLFVTFFMLKDGKQIWSWLIAGTGQYRGRIERAGAASFQTLSHYVQGTVMVSAVHSIAVAITLTIMGVPLVAPLAVLVFFSSFIPLVGILFAGGLALLVVFSTKGLIAGLIFLGILVVEQQLEGHLLQPLVVGRRLHFHPLGIIVILAVGGTVAGIPGAALAVPLTAIIYRAWPELRKPDPVEPTPSPEPMVEAALPSAGKSITDLGDDDPPSGGAGNASAGEGGELGGDGGGGLVGESDKGDVLPPEDTVPVDDEDRTAQTKPR